jgi:hypothetical protein
MISLNRSKFDHKSYEDLQKYVLLIVFVQIGSSLPQQQMIGFTDI